MVKNIVDTKYKFDAYPIKRFDQNFFLEFNIGNQKTLLVPCLTYFIYCYGISAELKRILTTYIWEEVKTRICGPINNMSQRNYLPVNLPRRLRDDDAVFVAHVMHDPYAEHAAKRVGAQLHVAHQSGLVKKVSLKVTPWFVEPMPVELLGVWLNSDVFLALTFTGISEPQGNAILLGRENSSSVETPYLGEGAGTAWKGALKPISSIPLIVIYSNYDPDPEEAPIEVKEPLLKILGERRKIYRIRRDKAKSSSGLKRFKASKGKAASGEFDSSAKGIASLSQIPNLRNYSSSRLLNMWYAALFISGKHPTIVKKVEWYSLKYNSFYSDSPPQLIGLDEYSAQERKQLTSAVKQWLYLDAQRQYVRGLLVMRLTLSDRDVYIVEVENSPENEKSDPTYVGLVFTLTPTCELDKLVSHLKRGIRDTCGKFSLMRGLLKEAATFKHSSSKLQQVECQWSVINALHKAGVPDRQLKILRTPEAQPSPIRHMPRV